jgi:hypothetical protein
MTVFQNVRNPYIRIALRTAKPGTGSSVHFLNRRTAVQPIPNLEAILGTITWVIVGGMAIRAYAPERMTLDVDILIHTADEQAARRALEAANYRIMGSLSIGGFTAEPLDASMPIDVLVSNASWLDQALQQPTRDSAGYPVLARQFLILLKLQAGRAQDIADITRLLRDTDLAERNAIRNVIHNELPDQVEDFDALVALTDLEFGG